MERAISYFPSSISYPNLRLISCGITDIKMKYNKFDVYKPILILTSLIVTFSGLFDHQVWTPDEPRVAAIIHNMYMTGNFIIPSYAEIPVVEKPPLFFIFCTLIMHITPLDAVMSGRLALALLCLGPLCQMKRNTP